MGQGSSTEEIITTTNELIANSFIESTTACQNKVQLNQQTTFSCDPALDGIEYYEDNASCVNCYTTIITKQEAQLENMKKIWAKQTTSGLNLNSSAIAVAKEFELCGSICKACVFTNISQLSNVNFQENCQYTTSMVNELSQNISGQFNQQLTNNQDVLSSFAQALGAKSNTESIITLTNRVVSNFSASLMAEMAQSVISNQIQEFKGGGSSTTTSANQVSSISVISKFLEKTNIVNNALSETEWDVFQQIQSDTRTIDPLLGAVSDSLLTVANVFDSVLGSVLLGVIIVMASIIVSIILVGIVKAAKNAK